MVEPDYSREAPNRARARVLSQNRRGRIVKTFVKSTTARKNSAKKQLKAVLDSTIHKNLPDEFAAENSEKQATINEKRFLANSAVVA